MKKIELLAPAGNMEAFEAALKAGADAIYLGGDSFGARKSAANFSDEALATVVGEAGKRGVKIYLTVNTLVYDREWEDLTAYLDRMAAFDFDAWIIQDLGVLRFVHERYPKVNLHASTQMSAQNLADLQTLKSLGVRRVVLPREMHLDEVREIAKAIEGIELEIFVHGALCVSVSGQCYMSSMIGGRSGNRGNCAQSCRQPYDLIDMDSGESLGEKTGMYRLSPRDLSTLDHIGDVIESGVASIKIEGRMKGQEFVYQTVRAYREAIDQHQTGTPIKPSVSTDDFKKIFNRGFTKGWLFGERAEDFLSSEIPGNQGVEVAEVILWDARAEEIEIELMETLSVGDELQIRKDLESSGCRVEYILSRGQRIKVAQKGMRVRINYKVPCQKGDVLRRTYDKVEMDRIRAMVHADARRVPVSVYAVLRIGAPLEVVLTDDMGHQGTAVSEALVEVAQKRPLDYDRIKEQLMKLGSTAYSAQTVELEMDENVMISIKALNEARRMAAEALDQKRLDRKIDVKVEQQFMPYNNEESDVSAPVSAEHAEDSSKDLITLCASVADLGHLHLVLEAGLQDVYFRGPLKAYEAARKLGERYSARIAWQWGRPNSTGMMRHHQEILSELKPEVIVVNSLGMVPWAKKLSEHVIADYGLNVLNKGTAEMLALLGADILTLSPELTAEAIGRIGNNAPALLEIVGYGHLPVMVTPHCPIRTGMGGPSVGCSLCTGKTYGLRDKTGAIFPIVKTGFCWTEVLNSRVLDLSEHFEMLRSLGVSRYRLHFTIETPDEVLEIVAAHLSRLNGKSASLITRAPKTRGHFYRGVL